jgi:hypothetical protein
MTVMLFNPITLHTARLKKLTNHAGITRSFAAASSALFLGDGVGETSRRRGWLREDVNGAGVRNEEVVRCSMYACVEEAVVLRAGARRRRIKKVGVREKVRPGGVIGGIVSREEPGERMCLEEVVYNVIFSTSFRLRVWCGVVV